MKIHDFIEQRPYLVWYVRDLKHLSTESIVEHVLNYGNWEDVKEMIHILGIKKVSIIFHRQIRKKRNNYRPEITNYFKLYFKKYA